MVGVSYRRCPSCKHPRSLMTWFEASTSDPGDVDPRAVCLTPDCTYEH